MPKLEGSTAELYRRISLVGDPKVSVVPILDRWVEEGRSVDEQALKYITRKLQDSKRQNHAVEVPMVPLARPGEIMHTQNYALGQSTTDSRNPVRENANAVMITWNYDGKQVSVTGSWDNWDKREPLHRSGKDFVVMKILPSRVFRYRFIVDEHLRYAPDLPLTSVRIIAISTNFFIHLSQNYLVNFFSSPTALFICFQHLLVCYLINLGKRNSC